MNEEKFREYLTKTNHTEKSIISRISRLKKIEKLFQLNIDSIIYNKIEVVELLNKIKAIDTKNQNLSNALRKYYECVTNNKIFKENL